MTIFTINLNPDGSAAISGDTYTITMQGVLDGATSQVLFSPNSGYTFVGGNDEWAGFRDITALGSKDLLLTPIPGIGSGGGSGGSINSNASSGGVGAGGSIGAGEALRIDFVIDLAGTPIPGGADYGAATPSHTFSDHYLTNGASATFTGISGGAATSDVRIKAWDDTINNDLVGDGDRDDVNAVTISYGGAELTVTSASIGIGATATRTVGGHDFTIKFEDVGGKIEVIVGSVVNGTQIATYTNDQYNSLEYHWAGGQDFKIGGFGTTAVVPGVPINFTVPVELVDGDGDTTSSFLGVTIAPGTAGADLQDYGSAPTPGGTYTADSALGQNISGSNFGDIINGSTTNNVLFGDNGADTISAGDGNDTLIGGQDNDTLNGGAGNDTYLYDLTDGSDTINETSGASGGTDRLTIVTVGSSLTGLSFVDSNTNHSAGNLVVGINGQTVTITNHFSNTPVESVMFAGGGSYKGFDLGTTAYTLSTTDINSDNRDVSASTAHNVVAGEDTTNDNIIGSAQKDMLFGNSGADTIFGGDGNDLLVGGLGNDILTGGDGDDVLIGGFGNDILNGSSGVDRFVFAESGAGNKDTIEDLVVGSGGDILDLSGLLDAAFSGGTVAGYVRVFDSNNSTQGSSNLQVDTSGTGANWVDVATLSNTASGVDAGDHIRIFFEGVEHDVIVTS